MQVAQSKLLGIVDDDCVGIGHVDTAFHNAGCDQYVIFVVHEVQDRLLQLLRLHLPMPHSDTGIRHLSTYQRLHLVDVLDAVVDEEHLSVTAHLEVDGLPDDVWIEALHLCLHRIAVGWGSRDA